MRGAKHLALRLAGNIGAKRTVLVGLLISLYGLTNASLQPFVGAWIDRVSRRKPFIQAGLVLMAIGTLAFLFAGRFTALLLIRGLQGIGVALTIPASLALMASATDKRTRGGSMGVYTRGEWLV